jgi:hypothetical protein
VTTKNVVLIMAVMKNVGIAVPERMLGYGVDQAPDAPPEISGI